MKKIFSFILLFHVFNASFSQKITTIAGGAPWGGEGGAAVLAKIKPKYVAAAPNGDIYFTDEVYNSVRKVSSLGIITTIAGVDSAGFSGDGGPAIKAKLYFPQGIALDNQGNVYVCDQGNNRIRKIGTDGIISTVIGTGEPGYNGDNRPANTAMIFFPSSLFIDKKNNIFFHDKENLRIRKVDKDGLITSVVGGTWYYEGTAASNADLGSPTLLSLSSTGDVLFYENDNKCIRSINMNGVLFHSAGINNVNVSQKDTILSKGASLGNNPVISNEVNGNLYIAERDFMTIRKINAQGQFIRIAGKGVGFYGDGGSALNAMFNSPSAIVADKNGNIFIADQGNHRIRKIDPSGIITTIAGNGTAVTSGDGLLAINASVNNPVSLALDYSGNLYVGTDNRIRKIAANGIITTVAGTGVYGYGADGTTAISAQIQTPNTISFDKNGNLYFTQNAFNRVRKINTAGIISTFAGNGTSGNTGDGASALTGTLTNPNYIVADSLGNVYVTSGQKIRRISFGGIITTFAGTGTQFNQSVDVPDGTPSVKYHLSYNAKEYQITADTSGFVYFARVDVLKVKRALIDGNINTYAGNGNNGFSGDGGNSLQASFSTILALHMDSKGNLYVGDINRIRKINSQNIISTVAGNGQYGYTGDGSISTSASLTTVTSINSDSNGNIYFVDAGSNRIRMISASGIINTIAGNGFTKTGGDGGDAALCQINSPIGITRDKSGNIYFADPEDGVIRKINVNGIITTIAGSSMKGFAGDGGLAVLAQLRNPTGIAIDGNGNIFFSEIDNHRVRKINTSGIISTIAGGGSSFLDGIPATSRSITPFNIVCDNSGNLYINDWNTYKILKVNTSGIITTFAGGGTSNMENILATTADLGFVTGMNIDSLGNILISDINSQKIRRITSTGIISTIAGGGTYLGDGGAALSSRFSNLYGVFSDASGTVYFFDNYRLKKITPQGLIVSVAGTGDYGFFGDNGPAIKSKMTWVSGGFIDPNTGAIIFADGGNSRIRKITPCASIPNAPVVSTSGSTTVCPNSGFTLSSNPGTSIQWLKNGAPINDSTLATIKPTESGDYSTRWFDANACASNPSNSVTVTIQSAPVKPVIISPKDICQQPTGSGIDVITLVNKTAANTLKWYAQDTIGVVGSTTAPAQLTDKVGKFTYYVSEVNSTGCESPRSQIIINVNGIPSAPGVADISYCNGVLPVALAATAQSNNTLNWYGANATGGTASATAPIPGTAVNGTSAYYVSQSAPGGCESTRSKINVTVNALPTTLPTVTALTLCQASTAVALTATASTGNTLSWFGTNAIGGTASASAPVPATTNVGITDYYVSERNAAGCDGPRSKLSVSVIASPAAPTVASLQYCKDIVAPALTAIPTSGNVLYWYGTSATGGTSTVTAPVPATNAAGVTDYYVVQRSSSGGCESGRSKLTVTVNDLPALPTVSNIGYCKDATASSLSASATTGNAILWYGTNATGGTATAVAPIPFTTTVGATDYYVSQRNNTTGCEGTRAKITVTIATPPVAPDVAVLNLCQGVATSALKATPAAGNTLLWFTTPVGGTGSATSPVPSSTAVGTTDYFVSQVSGGGCVGARAVLTVNVNAIPAAPVVSALGLCQQATANPLTATALSGHTLNWYGNNATGGTASTTAPTPSTAALGSLDYYVSQFNVNTGCESPRSKITATVYNVPGKANVSRDGTGNLVSDIANGNQWYKDGTAISGVTTQSFKPTENGNYTVKVTQNGCTGIASEVYYYLITALTNLNATESIHVYPNPVNDAFKLGYSLIGINQVNVHLYDESGKLVSAYKNLITGSEMSMAGLISGKYVLVVETKSGRIVYKGVLIKN